MVNRPAQYKFGPAYRHHLSLITKNIVKVYQEEVDDFIRFLQFMFIMRLFFSLIFLKRVRSFQLWPKKLISHKMLKNINCFGQNAVRF